MLGVVPNNREQPVELVILIGLQASGKTTFFKARFGASHFHLSKDNFRNARHPERRQQEHLREALEQSRSVVVDNTNPSVGDRAPLIALGREFRSTIVGYYFESRVEVCIERNRAREGKARIPDAGIYATIKKLERPSYPEGFDRLFYVRPTGDGDFEVLEWIEEEGE